MLTHFALALGVFSTSAPASAAFSIECDRSDRTHVHVSEAKNGYDLEDTGSSTPRNNKGIKPIKENSDHLEFKLDDGSSAKVIYAFKDLRECETEGSSNKVKLSISPDNPSESAEQVEELHCKCTAD